MCVCACVKEWIKPIHIIEAKLLKRFLMKNRKVIFAFFMLQQFWWYSPRCLRKYLPQHTVIKFKNLNGYDFDHFVCYSPSSHFLQFPHLIHYGAFLNRIVVAWFASIFFSYTRRLGRIMKFKREFMHFLHSVTFYTDMLAYTDIHGPIDSPCYGWDGPW